MCNYVDNPFAKSFFCFSTPNPSECWFHLCCSFQYIWKTERDFSLCADQLLRPFSPLLLCQPLFCGLQGRLTRREWECVQLFASQRMYRWICACRLATSSEIIAILALFTVVEKRHRASQKQEKTFPKIQIKSICLNFISTPTHMLGRSFFSMPTIRSKVRIVNELEMESNLSIPMCVHL